MSSTVPLHPAPSTIKLLVADDRLVVREGLKRLVAEFRDMEVVGEAATAEEVLRQADATAPDVLILDLFLVGPRIVGLTRDMTRRHPRCRVLVLSVQGQDPDALRILDAGAAGYLSKDYSHGQLIDAIRHVARGASYVSPSLARTLIAGVRGGGRKARHDALSHREYQVLCMCGSGIAFKQIAAELGLSPKTVSTYRARILAKLKLRGNADLIRYAIEHHLTTPSPTSPSAPPRRRKRTTRHSAGI